MEGTTLWEWLIVLDACKGWQNNALVSIAKCLTISIPVVNLLMVYVQSKQNAAIFQRYHFFFEMELFRNILSLH